MTDVCDAATTWPQVAGIAVIAILILGVLYLMSKWF